MTFSFHRGPSALTGQPITAAVTERSENRKTGDIPTVWILPASLPVTAARSGEDEAVCGSCPLRPKNAGGCYVALLRGPTSAHRSVANAPHLSIGDMWRRVRHAPAIRFCGWGDPAALPVDVWEKIHALRPVSGPPILGYTHMWRARPDLKGVCMASVHSPSEATDALREGWRPFLVAPPDMKPPKVVAGRYSFECPGTGNAPSFRTCAQCRACDGRRENDQRAFPWIHAHGGLFAKPRAIRFVRHMWEASTA